MATLIDKMDENPNLSREEAFHIAKSIIGSLDDKLEESYGIDQVEKKIGDLEQEYEDLTTRGVLQDRQQKILDALENLHWQRRRLEKRTSRLTSLPEESTDETKEIKTQSDEYYYHVTLAPYVPIIRKNGLKIKGIKPTVSNYKDYSKGKIFFTDVGTLDWWVYKIAEHAFHEFDDERFHDIAVFKVKKENLPDAQKDEVGSDDSKGDSFYITHDIPSSMIEFVKIEKSPY